MPVYTCAGTAGKPCPRLISVSSIPGGNPAALAEPEAWAVSYMKCACGVMVCDRCLGGAPETWAGRKCPKCEKPLILRSGRFGNFLACSGYPECRFTVSADKEGNPLFPEKWPDPCPECGREMIVRRGRRGRFVACTGYPECKKTLPYKKAEGEGETTPSEAPAGEEAAAVREGSDDES